MQTTQFSIENYTLDLEALIKRRNEFVQRCILLGAISHESRGSSVPFCNMSSLNRLLCIDHDVLGKTAVRLLQSARNYWLSKGDAENSQRASPPRDAGYQPRIVKLQYSSFAECIEAKGWIDFPPQCKLGVETLPVHTVNFPENFPPHESRELCAVAKSFGFYHAQDVDKNGKHFFHYLFTAMKYCRLFGFIAVSGFSQNSEQLPGDLNQAISHKTSAAAPKGWTPLHILCSASDVMMAAMPVCEKLLDEGIVTIRDFDSIQTEDEEYVSVFFGESCVRLSATAPLGLFSLPHARSMYVCHGVHLHAALALGQVGKYGA